MGTTIAVRPSNVTIKREKGLTRLECTIDNHRVVFFDEKIMLHIMSGEEIHVTKSVYNLNGEYTRRV